MPLKDVTRPNVFKTASLLNGLRSKIYLSYLLRTFLLDALVIRGDVLAVVRVLCDGIWLITYFGFDL